MRGRAGSTGCLGPRGYEDSLRAASLGEDLKVLPGMGAQGGVMRDVSPEAIHPNRGDLRWKAFVGFCLGAWGPFSAREV